MEEVFQFLTENHIFYFATTEDGQPRVRPFGFVMKYKGKLYFCTGSMKPVYRQLKANPKFEVCALSPKNEWLRLCGDAVFVDDLEAKKQAFREAPGVAGIYKDPASPDFALLYVDHAKATFQSMGSAPRTVAL